MSDVQINLDACVDTSLSAVPSISVPKYVGHFDILNGALKVHLENKPSLWFRFWVRVFFGARWVDEK